MDEVGTVDFAPVFTPPGKKELFALWFEELGLCSVAGAIGKKVEILLVPPLPLLPNSRGLSNRVSCLSVMNSTTSCHGSFFEFALRSGESLLRCTVTLTQMLALAICCWCQLGQGSAVYFPSVELAYSMTANQFNSGKNWSHIDLWLLGLGLDFFLLDSLSTGWIAVRYLIL